MKRILSWAACWLAMTASVVAAGDPALPGNHPLTQPQAGEVLIAELRCAACHSDIPRSSWPEKTAPDLSEAGARISPQYLQRFLASPASVHPSTTMPDVLASRPEAERAQIAEALTHFLVAQSKTHFTASRSEQADREQGKSLFHSVGCVACHGPKEALADAPPIGQPNEEDEDDDPETKARKAIKPIAVPLAHVATKYSVKSLSDFLFQPLRVRTSGRMPDMKLTPVEAQAIASYLAGAQPSQDQALEPQEKLVTQGKRYFQELNCAACHALPGITAAPLVKSLQTADLSRGCLSKTSTRSPRFELAEAQVKAIAAAVQAEPQVDTNPLVVAKTMTAFRCVACHVRDDYGGVPEAYSHYFVGSEQKLGDDGRIPPPLTLLGAKLQPTWLKKVLFDGESVRHYMATRMPQYGTANLQHLPAVVAKLDVLQSKTMNIPAAENRSEADRNREKLLRAGGRDLLGDKGLNCVACHTFNGKAAPGSQGIDLVTTTQRLQPGWFNSYVRNPGAFRPRTVMPSAWSNGIAAHQTILDGNTDMQIEAIWYYLSLGTSAAGPSGIRGVSTRLTVADQARTFRGRSRVAGYRGIAVGLPEKLSYAFNAETGALSALWQGDFIGVNWSGQGSGDFNPASEAITLAQDVSFSKLADENAPWPLLPVMTKEAKTNPDPLYPKNHGYQFRGYFVGEMAIPTFLYRSGDIEIEDRSIATGADEQQQLKRVLQFESPQKQVIWFRALTGDIKQESERVYRSGRLRLTIPAVETKLRSLSDEPKRAELLLHLQIPQGKSSLEFQYEPLKK
ncbi:c-type cytochrome [Anatilimnocola floriformis]|uniref:c-type cytochrome n=1 Tax=Anatilimnocola floriformis TaxID=2948575 RepID=UPI0020C3816F|nr:c-type cytochrome [Anatilimnocola floriformis]